MKKILLKAWYAFNILLTALGVINFGNDIFPALVRFSNFLIYLLKAVAWIRDIVLLPITFPLKEIFNLILFDWYKSYLFVGFLLFNTYNYSYKLICGHVSKTSLFRVFIGNKKLKTALRVLGRIFLWPIFLFDLVKHYVQGRYKTEQNVYTLWGKYIFWVAITVVVLVFFNWVLIQAYENFKNEMNS